MHRSRMKAFITLSLVLATIRVSAQNESPNIVLIIADDIGIDALEGFGVVGNKPVTPTLDSLRSAGITFTNCWAAPQCSPTRAAILTGEYGINNGVMSPPGPLDVEHSSLFTRMAEDSQIDYAMSVIGKWHLAGRDNFDHPADHGVPYYEGLFDSGVEDYYEWTKVTNGTSETVAEYATTHLTNAAIDWVDQQSKPWFLWLAHAAPHGPLQTPPTGTYQTSQIDDQSTYYAMIEAMDYEMGRFLHNIDRDNTVVIFIGDNGTPNNVLQYYPRGHGKASMYEGGIRVPMIIAGTGVSRAGAVEDELVQAADLHATILELLGFELPGGVKNSLSLKELLQEDTPLTRKTIYTDYDDDGLLVWAARNAQYKLIEDENGNQEFYDLLADLREQDNLIDLLTEEQLQIKNELVAEAATIRTSWSCNDGIQNGIESEIDKCDAVLQSSRQSSDHPLTVWPNPSGGTITIQLDPTGDHVVRLLTVDGKLAREQWGSGWVQMCDIPTGVYMLVVDNGVASHRLIVR